MSRRKTPQVSFDVGSIVPFRSPVRCPASALRFRAGDVAEFCDLSFLCKENLGLGSQVRGFLEGVPPSELRVLAVHDESFAEQV